MLKAALGKMCLNLARVGIKRLSKCIQKRVNVHLSSLNPQGHPLAFPITSHAHKAPRQNLSCTQHDCHDISFNPTNTPNSAHNDL